MLIHVGDVFLSSYKALNVANHSAVQREEDEEEEEKKKKEKK